MKNAALLLVLLLAILTESNAQASLEWAQSYTAAGTDDDEGSELELDAAGNVYVGGTTNRGTAAANILIMKYNSSGTRQWLQSINGSGQGEDELRDMVVDSLGNVYVTGASWGATVRFDMVTVKYNASGVRQWTARFDGFYTDDEANSIAVDKSGNVFVAGFTDKGNDQKDFCLVKYNSAGTRVWSRTLNGSGNGEDIASDVRLDAAGNIYLTGTSAGNGKDYMTMKYSPLGIWQWTARYTGTGNLDDVTSDMEVDAQGNVFVTGASRSLTTADDYATVKYNGSGVQQWAKRYNVSVPYNMNDEPRELILDNSGNVVVTGTSGFHPDYDMLTVKYSAAGTELWASTVDGGVNQPDAGWDIATDKAGNIYVGGGCFVSTAIYQSDYATIKYNSSGTILWKKFYNGAQGGGDRVFALKVFTTSPLLGSKVYVYVTGSEYTTSGSKITTIKYSQLNIVASPSLVGDEQAAVAGKLALRAFPNPVRDRIGVQYTLPERGHLRLVLYDIAGKKVKDVDKGNVSGGTYTSYLERANLSKGIYQLTLFFKGESSHSMQSKQVVLQ